MLTVAKAAVFRGVGRPFAIEEFPVPDPDPGGAVVEMDMAAVCGTDVHAIHDPATPHPMIFGHENIGVLAMAGKGLERDVLGRPLREGDRLLFRAAPCGRCLGCALGENCEDRYQYGFLPATERPYLTGGFSQYVVLHPARPWLLRVPDDMSTERALLSVIGNHTVSRGIQRMGGITLADTVVVQGSGPIGIGALTQSKIAGAQRVIVIGAPEHRLELAREMGADETVDLSNHPEPEARVEKVLQLTGGRGADVVIECAGAKTAVQEGLQMVRTAGRYLVVGSYTDYGPLPINPALIVRKALRVVGVAGSAPEAIIRSLQALHTIVPYPVEKLITHRYPLDQVNEAFRAHETLEAMVAVVTPNR
jgi:threonine dehydrogenase-like Zn-dependent dehydrogenase